MSDADPRTKLPLVTIVCPVFNEEETVPLFHERLALAVEEIQKKVRLELLFVNNRSTDGTLARIREIQEKDLRVNVITLSRNYGYQASITAGMRHARGEAIVNIDVDCEDPPEMIPRFIEMWLGGVDVAYGIRDKREEFFLVDRRVRDQVLSTRSTFPFVRGQVGYVGFRREGIAYKRQRRISGETHYNLISAGRFGIGGILSSSTLPLRLLAYVGLLGLSVDIALAVLVLVVGESWGLGLVERWSLAMVALQLGWMMFAFGGLGIYLARVYKDVIGLPLYVVDDKASFRREPPHE